MTVTEVAFGSARPQRPGVPPRGAVALFAAAFAVFGVFQAVYVFAGEDTYRDLTRDRGDVTFVTPDATWTMNEATLVHRQTLMYVLGNASEPARLPDGRPLFDANERSHLADVQAVFRAVGVVWPIAGIVLLALLVRALLCGYALRMLRDGALWAAAAVLVLAVVAAVAFEPAFLAFHYVFFPQGNFLFDPATSNLLRLYPETYWYGVTLRVGLAFITTATALAIVSWQFARSSIVTRR